MLNEMLEYPNKFCEAMFCELFLGPAQHVFVFFTDLLGIKKFTINRELQTQKIEYPHSS